MEWAVAVLATIYFVWGFWKSSKEEEVLQRWENAPMENARSLQSEGSEWKIDEVDRTLNGHLSISLKKVVKLDVLSGSYKARFTVVFSRDGFSIYADADLCSLDFLSELRVTYIDFNRSAVEKEIKDMERKIISNLNGS